MERRSIEFHFQPYGMENKLHVVEKAEGNSKRRYLKGVSSGPKIDQHGERITRNCIAGFMKQANSGDILLYPDVHGIRGSDDIGIMTKAEETPEGDWLTEYRLYDENDGIGPIKAERINDIWKQLNGQPPYKKPLQKGFSIEGYIPPEGIIAMSENGQRVIDRVDLDGVVLVPRPAYKDSIAHAVYKALGELAPWNQEKVTKGLESKLTEYLAEKEKKNQYFDRRHDLDCALSDMVQELMRDQRPQKQERLSVLFDEYKRLMTDLILNSESAFKETDEDEVVNKAADTAPSGKDEIIAKLGDSIAQLQSLLQAKRRIK